jgi:hypothetical protein
MSEADDVQARKARADAIRRARDERNARLQSDGAADGSATDDDDTEGESSNYVDLIDERMRRKDQTSE